MQSGGRNLLVGGAWIFVATGANRKGAKSLITFSRSCLQNEFFEYAEPQNYVSSTRNKCFGEYFFLWAALLFTSNDIFVNSLSDAHDSEWNISYL